MPTTHVLKNTHDNIWYLSTPQGQVVDSVIAPNHAEAAVAVHHLSAPRRGVGRPQRWPLHLPCPGAEQGVS